LRDLEGEFERARRSWLQRLGRFGSWLGWLIILVIVAFYLLSGFYEVGPAEVGLVKTFGAYTQTVGPGFQYHWPVPFQGVIIVNISTVRSEELGFRTVQGGPKPQYQAVPEEALMLTGDGNIAYVETVVQYQVKDPQLFAFNLIDPHQIVRQATEAVIREAVAKRNLDDVLTTQREGIASEAQTALQALLDRYQTGIEVRNVKIQDARPPDPVLAAFDDVNSARQDHDTSINQANQYHNSVLPKANGQAQQIINQAEAYKAQQMALAQGTVARFNDVLKQYQAGDQQVTRTRLYIETMEQILPKMNLIVLGPGLGGNTLNLLDLSQLLKAQTGTPGGNK
jgi:membrane protease subunit HflK